MIEVICFVFLAIVLFAMFLQAMYGAVDLLVVGQFGTDADVFLLFLLFFPLCLNQRTL